MLMESADNVYVAHPYIKIALLFFDRLLLLNTKRMLTIMNYYAITLIHFISG